MITIHKKIVTDENGKPTAVLIPIEEYREIEEILGLDLSEADLQSLKEAQDARRLGKKEAFHSLDDERS